MAEARERDEGHAQILWGELGHARGELAAEREDEGGARVDLELGEGVGDRGDLLLSVVAGVWGMGW